MLQPLALSNELLRMIFGDLPRPLIVDVMDESPPGFHNRIRLRWRRARGRTTFIKCPVPPSLPRSPKAVPQSGRIAAAGERNECLWAHLDGEGALVSAPTFLNSSNAAVLEYYTPPLSLLLLLSSGGPNSALLLSAEREGERANLCSASERFLSFSPSSLALKRNSPPRSVPNS